MPTAFVVSERVPSFRFEFLVHCSTENANAFVRVHHLPDPQVGVELDLFLLQALRTRAWRGFERAFADEDDAAFAMPQVVSQGVRSRPRGEFDSHVAAVRS